VKQIAKILTLVLFVSSQVYLRCETEKSNPGPYVFDGIQLMATHKGLVLPVVRLKRSGFIIESVHGPKRTWYSGYYGEKPRLSVASSKLDVSRNAFSIFDSGSGWRDSDGIYHESPNERYIATCRLSLLSLEGIKSAYCVSVVRFIRNNVDPEAEVELKSRVKVHRLGNLKAGIPKRVRIVTRTGEISQTGDLELYFFTSDGEPIATNESKGLRELRGGEKLNYQRIFGDAP